MALDTLEELGYKVSLHTETKSPVLHVIVDRNDLTSALEVAQAHGGRLLEGQASPSEISTYAMAYDPDGLIPIPAHFVNEVEPDEAEVHLSASAYSNRSSAPTRMSTRNSTRPGKITTASTRVFIYSGLGQNRWTSPTTFDRENKVALRLFLLARKTLFL